MTYETRLKLNEMLNDKNVLQMDRYCQHGNTSTLEHCHNVALKALQLAEKYNCTQEQMDNIVVGAMLHDYFLYDWHVIGRNTQDGIHAWSHPRTALKNAVRDFELNDKQRNIIRSHMFPTTLLHPPLCKEAVLVNIADKWCAFVETVDRFIPRKRYTCIER